MAAGDCLTPLEREVARLFDKGHSAAEISQELGKSMATIKRHITIIDNRLDYEPDNRDRAASQQLADRIRQFMPHVVIGSGQ